MWSHYYVGTQNSIYQMLYLTVSWNAIVYQFTRTNRARYFLVEICMNYVQQSSWSWSSKITWQYMRSQRTCYLSGSDNMWEIRKGISWISQTLYNPEVLIWPKHIFVRLHLKNNNHFIRHLILRYVSWNVSSIIICLDRVCWWGENILCKKFHYFSKRKKWEINIISNVCVHQCGTGSHCLPCSSLGFDPHQIKNF